MVPIPQRIRTLWKIGATQVGSRGAVRWFTYEPRAGLGAYEVIDLDVGDRHVQVSVSPTGRSVRVFVDGTEAKASR